MAVQENRINKLQEVNGTFFIGVVSAFKNISAITQIQCDELTANIDPAGWYPVVQLNNLFKIIEKGNSNIPQLLFQAGSAFIQAWYDYGGKELNHGSMGQLKMQGNSEGLKLVYRGFNEDEIYTKIIDMDEKEGFGIIETVSPFPKDFAHGVFYNAALMWEDMDWLEVDIEEWKVSDTTYKHLINCKFKLQTGEKMNAKVEQLMENITPDVLVSDDVLVELLWKLKGMRTRFQMEHEINKYANIRLGEFLNREREISKELNKAKKATEAALNKLKITQNKLIQSEKRASLGILTSGIAHEINNPLNFITGGTISLIRDFEDLNQVVETFIKTPEDASQLAENLNLSDLKLSIPETLKDIRVGTKRISEIVNGLLNFTKLGETQKTEANIHDGLNVTLLLLSEKIGKSIKIVKEFYSGLPNFLAHHDQLNQVFINILLNAIDMINIEQANLNSDNVKSNPKKILVKTQLIKGNILSGKRQQSNSANYIMVTIKDNGPGIPADIQNKIFDPFFTTKGIGEGAGLGLYTALSIIEKHGGMINLESKLGQGTVIEIKIPI